MTLSNHYAIPFVETNLRNVILKMVNMRPGINNVALVLECMAVYDIQRFKEDEYETELTKLIAEAEVIEIEFTLFQSDKISSVFFPRGTTFTLVSPPKQRKLHACKIEKDN